SVGLQESVAAANEKNVHVEEENVAQVDPELEALVAALREANEHLIVANLRSLTLTEQMTVLYEEARAAIQAKDDFFALISHELRTPLTSITGWAALLQRAPDSGTVAEAARSIASSAALQAKLVDDLLDVSRIMTGKFAITTEEIDLRNVVDDAVSAMRPTAAAQGISLRTNAQESIIIRGDAGRLRQVVGNLLSNAVKFTPSGGLVEVGLSKEDSTAILQVCDTGEGISPDFLPHVFDRRAQATARRFAGLGLGLAIVKHIVELHGGSVEAASQGQGKGATFTVRIPF
ncbi:MAG: sensor histidine kinase, partial [Thermoanaerobaculia bacterium]